MRAIASGSTRVTIASWLNSRSPPAAYWTTSIPTTSSVAIAVRPNRHLTAFRHCCRLGELIGNHEGEVLGESDGDAEGIALGVVDGVFPVDATDTDGFWTTGFLNSVIDRLESLFGVTC